MGALHAAPATGQHLLLDDVPWKTFEELSTALEEFPLRMTYDRGRLEIMPISHTHDWLKNLIRRMIEKLAELTDANIKSAGSTSQMRRGLDRSLEPDESYYLANEPLVRHKEELDFERDPPPDLVVEIDITNSSLDRLSMYAAMGVPEV